MLRAIASALSSGTRSAHIGVRLTGAPFAARYGREELVVLLPETALAGACVVEERLRQSIEDLALLAEQGRPVTISAGVATAHVADEAVDAVLRRADAALYRV